MITPERALDLVLERVPSPRVVRAPIAAALGRVLAEDVVACEDLPPFDRAMMDGFAVAASDAGKDVEVVGEVPAGFAPPARIEPGRALAVMTGAPCPEGTEAVVPVEEVTRAGGLVRLPERIAPGQHVQPLGALLRAGARTLTRGERLTPLGIANLAAFGLEAVEVLAPPRVAVVTTGDELVEPGSPRRGAAVRDANGPMLAAMAHEGGAAVIGPFHARDAAPALHEALERASAADIVVLSGGVSMGRYDLVPEAALAAGFEPVFHGVTQKPGKPLLFAASEGRLLFGLPGNSRSSHFCFARYVAAALRAWSGQQARSPERAATLLRPLEAASKRTLFLPVLLDRPDGGDLAATPFEEKGSADIFTVARANGYARLEPGEHHLPAGSRLFVQPLVERSFAALALSLSGACPPPAIAAMSEHDATPYLR